MVNHQPSVISPSRFSFLNFVLLYIVNIKITFARMGKSKESDVVYKKKIKFVPLSLCSTGIDRNRRISCMKGVMYNLKWVKCHSYMDGNPTEYCSYK